MILHCLSGIIETRAESRKRCFSQIGQNVRKPFYYQNLCLGLTSVSAYFKSYPKEYSASPLLDFQPTRTVAIKEPSSGYRK